MPLSFITAEELDTFTAAPRAMLYFTATWCGPCQAIKGAVDALESEFPLVNMAKIDLDLNREAAQQLQVTLVPTFYFFKNGEVVDTVRGANIEGVKAGLVKLAGVEVEVPAEVEVPQGFAVVGAIAYPQCEVLNAVEENAVDVLKEGQVVRSSDDGQLLLRVAFGSTIKLTLVWIKTGSGAGLQPVTRARVYANRGLLDFDEAEEEEPEGDVALAAEGWNEVKLRYVKFQKINSVGLVLEGDDEDGVTQVERVLFVGRE